MPDVPYQPTPVVTTTFSPSFSKSHCGQPSGQTAAGQLEVATPKTDDRASKIWELFLDVSKSGTAETGVLVAAIAEGLVLRGTTATQCRLDALPGDAAAAGADGQVTLDE